MSRARRRQLPIKMLRVRVSTPTTMNAMSSKCCCSDHYTLKETIQVNSSVYETPPGSSSAYTSFTPQIGPERLTCVDSDIVPFPNLTLSNEHRSRSFPPLPPHILSLPNDSIPHKRPKKEALNLFTSVKQHFPTATLSHPYEHALTTPPTLSIHQNDTHSLPLNPQHPRKRRNLARYLEQHHASESTKRNMPAPQKDPTDWSQL